jgi:hypothetical protein
MTPALETVYKSHSSCVLAFRDTPPVYMCYLFRYHVNQSTYIEPCFMHIFWLNSWVLGDRQVTLRSAVSVKVKENETR